MRESSKVIVHFYDSKSYTDVHGWTIKTLFNLVRLRIFIPVGPLHVTVQIGKWLYNCSSAGGCRKVRVRDFRYRPCESWKIIGQCNIDSWPEGQPFRILTRNCVHTARNLLCIKGQMVWPAQVRRHLHRSMRNGRHIRRTARGRGTSASTHKRREQGGKEEEAEGTEINV